MKSLIFVLFAFSSLTAFAGHPKFGSQPNDKILPQICTGSRLTIMKFYLQQPQIIAKLRTEATEDLPLQDIARFEADLQDANNAETCAWNRFFFVDSVLYFQLEKRLVAKSKKSQSEVLTQYRHSLLNLRQDLLEKWLQTFSYQDDTRFAEWNGHDLKGKTIDEFLKRRVDGFKGVRAVVKVMNAVKAKDPQNEAGSFVNQLLSARTPFHSIFTRNAFELSGQDDVQKSISCLKRKLNAAACEQNIFDMTLACVSESSAISEDQKKAKALEVLGVFASQRMYLLRDLKTWMEQNLPAEEYQKHWQVFQDGTEIYFKMEEFAVRCGSSQLLPSTVKNENPEVTFSNKPYHFYSVAYLADQVKQSGIENEDLEKEVLVPAMTYKKTIKKVGMISNLLLFKPLKTGTVGDTKQVLLEQRLGAEFGLAENNVRKNP